MTQSRSKLDEIAEHEMGHAYLASCKYRLCMAGRETCARSSCMRCSVLRWLLVCVSHLPILARLAHTDFKSRWIYSSTLAYVVDANVGRSSTAVACNSCFRGTLGFVAAEVAVPLQNSIGDGGLYTLWGGLLALVAALIWLLIWKGKEWREKDVARMSR